MWQSVRDIPSPDTVASDGLPDELSKRLSKGVLRDLRIETSPLTFEGNFVSRNCDNDSRAVSKIQDGYYKKARGAGRANPD